MRTWDALDRGHLFALAGIFSVLLIGGGVLVLLADEASCNERAPTTLRLLRTEALAQVPPELRGKAYASTGCDSFDRPYLTWKPKGDPQATVRVLADRGWTPMGADALRGYDSTSIGLLRKVDERTIEVVLTRRPSDSFQASLD